MMRFGSAKWKWFGIGSALCLVGAIVATIHLTGDLVAGSGDPALAPPLISVAVSVLMTFFGVLIPLVALVGAMVIMVDGYARRG